MADVARLRLRAFAVSVLLLPLAASGAARVTFTVGDVVAVDANGRSRPLAKGAEVDEGDTIETRDGRAQLSFSDGAYVSLQPGSQFRIDEYRFSGHNDGGERGIFTLIRGGLRTITGLIGRTNRSNYRVRTAIATIGIRGTEYTMVYAEALTGTVGEGEIDVCNGAGCLNVTSGQSYAVAGESALPVITDTRSDLPPPPPVADLQPQFVFGDALICSPPTSRSCSAAPLADAHLLAPPPSRPPVTTSTSVSTGSLIPAGRQQSMLIH